MIRIVSCLILLGVCLPSQAQIRVAKLSLNKSEKYLIQASDILVVDTLIMADSSQIILNHDKPVNFIHAKIALIGTGCSIIGAGAKGTDGKHGEIGIEQNGPCRQGGIGKDGTGGGNGSNGSDLFIYSDDIHIKGSLTFNLNGGDGGDGGDGGQGGGGGPGTRVCQGGDGGRGGNGSKGGDGGNGGNLSINCKRCPDYLTWVGSKLHIKNYGGFGGLGGEAGRGGLAGLGPIQDGKNGQRGYHGEEGVAAKNGSITSEKK